MDALGDDKNNPVIASTDKKTSGKKKFLQWNWKMAALLGVLILLLIGVAGYFTLRYSNSKSKKASNASEEQKNTNGVSTQDNTTSTVPTTGNSTTPSTSTSTSGKKSSSGGTSATQTATVTFAVTSTSASADRTSVCSNVDTVVNFIGTITSNKAGTVHYHWARSDGGVMADALLDFTAAGTKQVVGTSWTMPAVPVAQVPWYLRPFVKESYALSGGTPPTRWEQIVVTSPNAISSNRAEFTYMPCIN